MQILNSSWVNQFLAIYRRHDSSILNPALWAVLNYYFGRWAFDIRNKPMRWIASKIFGVNYFLILIVSNIRLNREAMIGKDLHLIHSGNIHVHPKAIVGERCGIQQDVVIGIKMDREGAPIIGNDVYIGAGAKVLGNIKVGDGARIAANSLVIMDVPPNATAIGVPARVMKYTGRTQEKSNR